MGVPQYVPADRRPFRRRRDRDRRSRPGSFRCDPENIRDAYNNNLAYFNDPTINAELDQASLLTGAARYTAYGNLDVEITTSHAPWVAYDNHNLREFTSARLGGYFFQPANASADLNTFFAGTRSQSISFDALADKTFGDADFTVSASASSGLAVSFGGSGNCTVSGATVHLTGAGSCTVTASQPGDATYKAWSVSRSFGIAKAGQTITFGPLVDRTSGSPDFNVSASASSALAVSFASSGSCSVSGATVHLTGAGSCTVTASQPGDANYKAASDVSRTFSVTPLKPPNKCVVPNVIGKRLASAKVSITKKHCGIGKVSRAYSRKIKKGLVVSQSRRRGRVLPAKSKINLVVSRGRKP